MNDLVLYRKYRPQKFNEVLGQEHIISVLEGAVKQKHIAHAYLFSGTRGTGKTSVARIFAREIGCTDKDLYEIDAASNTSVEDIRELREGVYTLPFDSPYKVYIIDEVHMLSKSAFNAFLKTLEEPPKHVVFILATTEEEKLPDTIVSRCISFTFKKPSQSVLKAMVLSIAKKEGFSLEPSSADLIALLSDGSFRDAHGILQKILFSSRDKKVSVPEVEMVTGAPKASLVNQILSAIAVGDSGKGLAAIAEASESGVEMKTLGKLLLHKLRAVLLYRYAADMRKELEEEFSEDDLKIIKDLALDTKGKVNSDVLREFLSAYSAIGRSYIAHLPLELALVRAVGQDTK